MENETVVVWLNAVSRCSMSASEEALRRLLAHSLAKAAQPVLRLVFGCQGPSVDVTVTIPGWVLRLTWRLGNLVARMEAAVRTGLQASHCPVPWN